MKKIAIVLLSFFAIQVSAQNFAEIDVSVLDIAFYPNGAHRAAFAKIPDEKAALLPRIKVIYSCPLMKGRKVFGELVKFDEGWRMSANESTEVTFYTPVMIGESVLDPGRYALYCIPSKDNWTLKVHPNLDGWGNFGYDSSKDLASVTAQVTKFNDAIVALSMTMYKAESGKVHLKVGWENSIVEFPITLL
jgi:hypothetical protein